MRTSNLIFIFTFLSSPFLFSSCVKDPIDSCGGNGNGPSGPGYTHYETMGFSISGIQERSNNPTTCAAQPGSPSSPCLVPYSSQYVKATDIVLTLVPQAELRAQLQRDLNSPAEFSFFNQAYACSPPVLTTAQEVVALSVRSQSDFNNSFPANSNLVSLMEILNTDGSVLPLDSYAKQPWKDFLLESSQVTFNTSPTSPSKHVLTFLVTLKDSTHFSFKSDTLKIN